MRSTQDERYTLDSVDSRFRLRFSTSQLEADKAPQPLSVTVYQKSTQGTKTIQDGVKEMRIPAYLN